MPESAFWNRNRKDKEINIYRDDLNGNWNWNLTEPCSFLGRKVVIMMPLLHIFRRQIQVFLDARMYLLWITLEASRVYRISVPILIVENHS